MPRPVPPCPPYLPLPPFVITKTKSEKKRKTEKGSQTSLSSFQLTKYLSPSFIYASVCERGCVSEWVCVVCVAHSNVINTRYIKLWIINKSCPRCGGCSLRAASPLPFCLPPPSFTLTMILYKQQKLCPKWFHLRENIRSFLAGDSSNLYNFSAASCVHVLARIMRIIGRILIVVLAMLLLLLLLLLVITVIKLRLGCGSGCGRRRPAYPARVLILGPFDGISGHSLDSCNWGLGCWPTHRTGHFVAAKPRVTLWRIALHFTFNLIWFWLPEKNEAVKWTMSSILAEIKALKAFET